MPAKEPAADAFDRSTLRQFIVLLVAFKIVGILLFIDPNGLQAFDLPKSLLSRALSFVIAGLLTLSFLRFGLSIFPRTRLHIPVVLFLVANLVSGFFAESRYLALFGENERYLGLTFLADMFVLYVAVAVAVRELADYVVCFGAMAFATLLVVSYAAVQYTGADPLNWIRYQGDRPFSTLGLADQLGHFLSLSLGLALGVAIFTDGVARSRARWVAAAFVFVVVSASAVVATRGTLLGIAAALVAAFILRARVGSPASKRRLRGVIALSGVAAAVLIVLASSPLGERAARTVDDLGSGRLGIYRVAARAFIDRPVIGYGPDNLGAVYSRYQDSVSDGLGSPQTSAHDWPLQTLVTTGVVGLATQLLLLLSFGVALWGKGLARMPVVAAPLALASVAYWVNGLVDVGSISVDWFPWFAFGAIASLTGRRLTGGEQRTLPLGVGGIVVVASILAASSLVNAFVANRNAQTARSALAVNQSTLAFDAASAAVRSDPGRADYWNWLGLSLEGIGATSEASAAYAEAARRAPYEATYWGNLALVKAREAGDAGGDPSLRFAALDAARRCVDADPMSWRAHSLLGKVAYQLGEYDLALESALTSFRMTVGNQDRAAGHAEAETIAVKASSAVTSSSALELLERALGVQETAALDAATAGVALRLGDKTKALDHARRALVIDPKNAEARVVLNAVAP